MNDPKKRKVLMAGIFGTGAAAAGAAIAVKKHRQKKAAEAETERKRLEEEEKKLKEAKDLADKKEAFDRSVRTLQSFVLKAVPKNIEDAQKMINQVPNAKSIELRDALQEWKDEVIEPSNKSIKTLSDTIQNTKDVEISDDVRVLLKSADEAISKNDDTIKKIDKALEDFEDVIDKHRDILNGHGPHSVKLHIIGNGFGLNKSDVAVVGESVWIFMIEDYLNKTLKAFKHFSQTSNITDDEKKILVEKTDFSSFGKEIPLREALNLYSGDYIDRITTIFTSIAEVDKTLVVWINSFKDSSNSEYQKSIDLLNSMENKLVKDPQDFIKMFFDGFSKDFESLIRAIKFFDSHDFDSVKEKGLQEEGYNTSSKLYPPHTETDSEGGVWFLGPGNASARSRKDKPTHDNIKY